MNIACPTQLVTCIGTSTNVWVTQLLHLDFHCCSNLKYFKISYNSAMKKLVMMQ